MKERKGAKERKKGGRKKRRKKFGVKTPYFCDRSRMTLPKE